MPGNGHAGVAWTADARLRANDSPTRTPLGNVSPNVRQSVAADAALGKKPLSGSPLKRSFTAAMEDGQGLRYLKKRKLVSDISLSQVNTETEQQSNLSPIVTQNGVSQAKLNAVPSIFPTVQEPLPTEPGTPTESSFKGDDGEESSEDRRSFSSLINYDSSSQNATAPGTQQPQQQLQQASGLLFDGPSYATMLRLRLRVAMYKVQTNQVHVPFEELQVEQSPAEAAPSPPKDSGNGSFPRLLPAPILLPTPYSSRMVYGRSLPSSPLVAGSPDKLPFSADVATPARSWKQDEADLTSSIVKGRVAEGLLGLRNAV